MIATDPPRPWRTHFPHAARWDAPLEIGTLPALLERSVAAAAERPALSFREATLSYDAFGESVARLAAGFLREGLGPGATVALYLPNTLFHPLCFFALASIGARITHISPLDAPREIEHKLADSGAVALVTTNLAPLMPRALAIAAGRPGLRLFIGDDDRWGDAGAALAFEPGENIRALDPLLATPVATLPQVSPDAVALLQYSGGTTGLPKAAMLTHGNLTAAVAMYSAWNDDDLAKPGEGRAICVLPLFHIYALTSVMLRAIAETNELLLHARFDAETIVKSVETRRATSFAGVPTMWTAIANLPGVENRDFSSLRICASGGAPMPFEMEARVSRLLRRKLTLGWGMTETAPAGTRAPADAAPRPGLIGIPLPHIDMRIVALDDPRRALGADETGEIAIRGANVTPGYWNRPEETASAFCDGWFLTGDIGAMDEKGLFRIFDRKKNMIISSGFNVYPTAIENALYEHPGVREAIVIGVEDSYRGQAAKAFLSLKPGAAAPTLADIQCFLADRLGRHEIPTQLEIREELPKSAAGKLLARALIEEERARAALPAAGAS